MDGVTIITVFRKVFCLEMKTFLNTCALLAVPFKKMTAGGKRKIIRFGEVRLRTMAIVTERRSHPTRLSSSSPRKRFSSVTAKHTRRARKKLKKLFSMNSQHCSRISFTSLSLSLSQLEIFKLKIIHSASHMWDLLGC